MGADRRKPEERGHLAGRSSFKYSVTVAKA
jgi:hypothetical protein